MLVLLAVLFLRCAELRSFARPGRETAPLLTIRVRS
jgi:hypothetical protein